MKKTIIALLSLSGLALATTSDLTTFTWDTSSPYKDCTTVSNEGGSLTYTNGGWWVSGPTATLQAPIELAQNDTLTFSFTCDFNVSNSVLTMALAGDNGAVVMGRIGYNNNGAALATTTETGDAVLRGYAFANTNNAGQVANITDGYTTLGTDFAVNSSETVNANKVTFVVAYDTAKSQFVGTMTLNDKSASVDLGETFKVNAITATFDGASNYVAHVDKISLSVVPEPATATLSLLALAGLAARRRRH